MGSSAAARLTQYAAFVDVESGVPRVGHFDLAAGTIQPLSFKSGTPVANLYQVIEAGPSNIIAVGDPIPAATVRLLPPIAGRDVLAVGKNYMEHAKEFNSSGYDSSDKVDRPSHPVIFTKRATSIIADGEEIYPHEDFTETLDYEGEIGVIVGKPGFRISEEDAWSHVWGYTIINDLTARERQRDHKQFFIGKSADTLCPVGPIAVPKEDLPSTLRVQTHVNGELRQNSTAEDLIFSIPTLISAISEGQTLQAGDVLATGTPAGVGLGLKPPVFLQPGDTIAISVTGLGTLRNKVAPSTAPEAAANPLLVAQSSLALSNAGKSIQANAGLTRIGSKFLHYRKLGSGTEPIVFVHGLGGTLEFWTPLISTLALGESYVLHLFDLEGQGLSPTHPLSELTVESFATDLRGIYDHAGISPSNPAVLVAHSIGSLAALRFTLDNPGLVKKLVLLGLPPSPLPEAASMALYDRAALVRTRGMSAVVDHLASAGTSDYSKQTNALAVAAVRLSFLGQDPEGYAKGCWALAKATSEIDVEGLATETLIIAGEEDTESPPALSEAYSARIKSSRLVMLKNCGNWHVFENVDGVARALKEFL